MRRLITQSNTAPTLYVLSAHGKDVFSLFTVGRKAMELYMKIAAYCRVSTDKKEQLSSLENQRSFFKDFAERNGHTLVRIYSDEGISGKQMKNRPEFLNMLKDAGNHNFEMLVVKDISRFARNTVDFLTSIRHLKALGIETVFLSVNQTILSGGEFVLTLFSALAQEESANLSARIRFGKHQSALLGKVPNFVYGYDRIDKYTLQINPEQAKTVNKIFTLYCNGKGSRKIADYLSKKEIPTLKNCTCWSPKTVRRMLSNPLYNGVLISRKTETADFISGSRRKVSGDLYTFTIPSLKIVDDKVFKKVQNLISQRSQPQMRLTTFFTKISIDTVIS